MDIIKYKDLVRVLDNEKAPSLSTIPNDFYLKAYEYINKLEKTNQDTVPRGHCEVELIHYELKNARSILDKIFIKRTQKIIKTASIKAFSRELTKITNDTENMTSVESEVYQQILNTILTNKKNTIDPIRGVLTDNIKSTHIPITDIAHQTSSNENKDVQTEILADPADKICDDSNKDVKKLTKEHIVIRLLRDIPAFIGVDGRRYGLGAHDVAYIPKVNANALIKRKVAVQINV